MSTDTGKSTQKLVGVRLSQEQYAFCESLAKKLYANRVIPNDHIQSLFKLAVTKLVDDLNRAEAMAEAELAAKGAWK